MTKSKTRLPLAIPHPLQIPTNWTPGQALAAFEIIDDLRNAIWRCYEQKLLAEYHKQWRQAAAALSQNKISTMICPSELQNYPWNRRDTSRSSLSLAERTHRTIPS